MVRVPEANQTAAEQGEAELRILNSKTTWSEFQKPIRPLLSEAKPSYVYSISKPHGQRFRNPNCCSQQHFNPLVYVYWTWSEFQRPSQTSAAHGKDGLHMFYSKATVVRG